MTWGRGSTRKSRKVRAQVLRRNPTCTCPGCPRCSSDPCIRPSTDDDHVIPVSQGGTDHPSNHRGLCSPCHDYKSQQEALAGRRWKTRPTPKHPGVKDR